MTLATAKRLPRARTTKNVTTAVTMVAIAIVHHIQRSSLTSLSSSSSSSKRAMSRTILSGEFRYGAPGLHRELRLDKLTKSRRLPRRPAATGEPFDPKEQWDLFDLPDLDVILYASWEALLLHRIQHFSGVALGLVVVLAPWYWLALAAVAVYFVIDYVATEIDLRSKRWIDRTPMDREYCRRWLKLDRVVGAYGLAAMFIVIMVRFG
jgi:hypothetical protein